MTIADTIQSMYDNVSNAYNVLEVAGADLTNVNKNILNLKTTWQERLLYFMNNGTDVVWNNWDKVTGEGTTLTLNNTLEGKMKIVLKGNTSQETAILPSEYTQVDYITSSGTQYIDTGVKLSPDYGFDIKFLTNNDLSATGYGCIFGGRNSSGDRDYQLTTFGASPYVGTLRWGYASGAGTASADITLNTVQQCSLKSKTFTSCNGTVTQLTTTVEQSDYNCFLFGLNNGTSGFSQSGNGCRIYYCKFYDGNNLIRNFVPCYRNSDNEVGLYDLVNNVFYTNAGTGAFTYGAVATLPNPDYPQDIHVVSGDNSINVCGKNLFDKDNANILNAYLNVDNGKITNSNPNRTLYIPCNSNTTYTLTKYASPYIRQIGYTTELPANNVDFYGKVDIPANETTGTITTGENAKYLVCRIIHTNQDTITQQQMLDSIQIEKGSTATTYEAYKGASYPINLPIKNLFTNVVYKDNYVINSTGGETYSTLGCIWEKIEVKPNTTYTLSYTSADYTFGQRVSEYNSSDTFIQRNSVSVSPYTFTTTANTKYINLSGLKTDTNIQIEEGTKANSYTPYGTTPIELCKIGDYQDSIKKSTGKNLFDKNNAEQIKNWFVSNNKIEERNGITLFFIKCEPSTQYTISKISSTRLQFWCSVEKPAIGVATSNALNNDYNFTGTTKTITTTSDAQWLICYYYNANTDTKTEEEIRNSIMLNEGTTALPYEPYGTGWYLNKQIGKLDNDIVIISYNSTYRYYTITPNITGAGAKTYSSTLSTHFQKTGPLRIVGSNSTNLWLWDENNYFQNATEIKQFMINNNVKTYYILNTPTYTEITDSTLLSQLNALLKARSYDGQTNITQTNNDLPFIINATALKEMA